MASASVYDSSESESCDDSGSEKYSDEEDSKKKKKKPACKYYNSGGCKNDGHCQYLHVCKYHMQGNCQYGANCKLNHSVTGAGAAAAAQPATPAPKLTDGRPYQWQLNNGSGWQDIANDHIIEAHYSLPSTKSIKIYNTTFGAVSVNFKNLTVDGKNLRVRRLSDGNTRWVWFCMLRKKWIKYGDKNDKGVSSPVSSSDIEKKFQKDRGSSCSFKIGATTYEIRFKAMLQVSPKGKAKVGRRPLFQPKQSSLNSRFRPMSLKKPVWQYEGDHGAWYEYKHRHGTPTESSTTSDEIERKYQSNKQGSFTFTVNRQHYKLDFRAMTQTNLQNKNKRKVRRVLV